jgi:uncharacterized C2H2 Zn-finger protein
MMNNEDLKEVREDNAMASKYEMSQGNLICAKCNKRFKTSNEYRSHENEEHKKD